MVTKEELNDFLLRQMVYERATAKNYRELAESLTRYTPSQLEDVFMRYKMDESEQYSLYNQLSQHIQDIVIKTVLKHIGEHHLAVYSLFDELLDHWEAVQPNLHIFTGFMIAPITETYITELLEMLKEELKKKI
jgi:hypothetical protein